MRKVTLFALSTCPVCKKVKAFLDEHNIQHEIIEVDTLDSGEQWLMTKELQKYNPQATYPTLVICDVLKGYDSELLKKKLIDAIASESNSS